MYSNDNHCDSNKRHLAYATVTTDIFQPNKFGGKYTVTLIPGMKSQEM